MASNNIKSMTLRYGCFQALVSMKEDKIVFEASIARYPALPKADKYNNSKSGATSSSFCSHDFFYLHKRPSRNNETQ
jgi:hypothetical protein